MKRVELCGSHLLKLGIGDDLNEPDHGGHEKGGSELDRQIEKFEFQPRKMAAASRGFNRGFGPQTYQFYKTDNFVCF